MSKKFLIIFAWALCFLTCLETKAQSPLKNSKIPENLIIKYWNGSGIGWSEFTIKSDGTVLYDSYSNMPSNPNTANFLELLGKNKKIKKPKLKDKLSGRQLKKLIAEFEKVKFFNFPNRILNSQDGCTNEIVSSNAQMMSISIQINEKTAQVSSDIYCNGMANSTATKFANLGRIIKEMLRDVRATKSKQI